MPSSPARPRRWPSGWRTGVSGAQVRLYYTIFRDYDAICRHVEVENPGNESLWLERLMAMSLDLPRRDYDLVTLSGSHLQEKVPHRRPVTSDTVLLESSRGASSPQQTPCVILTDPNTDEASGQVWAVNFVYSGDFQATVQAGQYGGVRVQMGMNPLTFGWELAPGQRFVSPECVLGLLGRGAQRHVRGLSPAVPAAALPGTLAGPAAPGAAEQLGGLPVFHRRGKMPCAGKTGGGAGHRAVCAG